MGIGKIAERWGVLIEEEIEGRGCIRERGEVIYVEGERVASYLPGGYWKVSLRSPVRGRGVPRGVLFKMSLVTAALNPLKAEEELIGFLCEVLGSAMEREFYVADREEVEEVFLAAKEKGVSKEELAERRYYYWWKVGMSWEEKMSVVNKHRGRSIVAENVGAIDRAVEELVEEGKKFVTYRVISKKTGLSVRTVERHLNEELREKIGEYNAGTFAATTWQGYLKEQSIADIVGTIRKLRGVCEKVTKKRVSEEAEVHYNTIKRWWEEEAIQRELNKYNEKQRKKEEIWSQ